MLRRSCVATASKKPVLTAVVSRFVLFWDKIGAPRPLLGRRPTGHSWRGEEFLKRLAAGNRLTSWNCVERRLASKLSCSGPQENLRLSRRFGAFRAWQDAAHGGAWRVADARSPSKRQAKVTEPSSWPPNFLGSELRLRSEKKKCWQTGTPLATYCGHIR